MIVKRVLELLNCAGPTNQNIGYQRLLAQVYRLVFKITEKYLHALCKNTQQVLQNRSSARVVKRPS